MTYDATQIAAMVARLRGQDAIPNRNEVADFIITLAAERDALIDRVKVLEGALKPFADIGETAIEMLAYAIASLCPPPPQEDAT